MKITIQQYIDALEDEPISLDEFYARLLAARSAIEERLDLAEGDNVDLQTLEEAEEC